MQLYKYYIDIDANIMIYSVLCVFVYNLFICQNQ